MFVVVVQAAQRNRPHNKQAKLEDYAEVAKKPEFILGDEEEIVSCRWRHF